jgi:phosphotransacetylase
MNRPSVTMLRDPDQVIDALSPVRRTILSALAELRPRRGLTERIMRRTSDVVLVDPTAFDTSGLTQRDVAGLSGVVSTATDLIRQAAQVTVGAGASGERISAASLDTEIRVAGPAALNPRSRRSPP